MLAQPAGNVNLGENLPFVPPESSHPLKRRAVVITAVGESTVTFLLIERLGTTSADFCDVHLDRRGCGRGIRSRPDRAPPAPNARCFDREPEIFETRRLRRRRERGRIPRGRPRAPSRHIPPPER